MTLNTVTGLFAVLPGDYLQPPVKSLAEANERILESLRVAGNAVAEAAITYAQVVTEGLWREGFDTRDEWERWLNKERQGRNIPRSTWYYWLTVVGYLLERGYKPERLRKDFRPAAVYAAAKADGYRKGRGLAEDARDKTPDPDMERLIVKASGEADLPWQVPRPATETLNTLAQKRKEPQATVQSWTDTASDGFITIWLKNLESGEVHGFGVGDLPAWAEDWLRERLGWPEALA